MAKAADYLTHDELQHIEHATKVLTTHIETVQYVVNESERLLNTFVPIMRGYVDAVRVIRVEMGQEVVHLLQSSRELGGLTKQANDLREFCVAVKAVRDILTPDVIETLRRFQLGKE